MVGEDGRLVPITDLNPDHPTLFNQPEPSMPTQPSVAPPFADTAEHQPSQEFVDGLNDVAAGSLLTTEQVYALMRGDVEGAQEHASWDEGVPLAEPKAVERKTTSPARKASAEQSAAPSNAWKEWDEQ